MTETEEPPADVYEVEKIIDYKELEGRLFYQVKWLNYEISWEPEERFMTQDILAEYWLSLEAGKL